jgi:hypothetical protein
MFCPDCGAVVAEGKKFCGKCGGRLHAGADESIAASQVASESPAPAVAQAPRPPLSTSKKLTYALVALLVVLGGVAWWWFHRPAPAYKVQDPGIYPFQGLSADGKAIKTGFIDADGKVLIQPEWDGYGGTAILGQPVAFSEGLCGVLKDGKWGYIDTGGHLVIPNQFDSAGPFVEGVAKVNLGNQIGFIDKTGKYVINPQFYEAGDFHGGLAAVRVDGGWGFINKAGSFAIKPQFQAADTSGFSQGLAAVCPAANSLLGIFAGKCGYINSSGTFVIKPQFSSINTFSDGMAAVQVNGKWGYIDTSGRIVINPQFDGVTLFSDGLAVVTVSGKSGTVNKQGKYVLNPGQFNILAREGALEQVSSSDGVGLIGRDGKWAVNPSKVLTAIPMIIGKVFYGVLNGQFVPISTSGKVLAGWYKGATLDSLAQVIENEKSAIASMRALIGAETNYAVLYPDSQLNASVEKLGPASGTPDEKHANIIDAALATGTKDGYQFTESLPPNPTLSGINYIIVAKPVAGQAGRTFCTESSGVIRFAAPGDECSVTSPTL